MQFCLFTKFKKNRRGEEIMSKKVKRNLLLGTVVTLSIIMAICFIVNNAYATAIGDTRVDSSDCDESSGSGSEPCLKKEECTALESDCVTCKTWSPVN